MDKTTHWLIRVAAIIVIGGCLITYLNFQKKPSLLFSKPSIEDLRYKDLDKKSTNVEYAAKRGSIDYSKFGSAIFCNYTFNS